METYLVNEPFLMPHQDEPFNGDGYIAKEFLVLRDKYNIKKVLEFGSCVGGTTTWLSENFKEVITTEINEYYRGFCLQRIASCVNVTSILGDTVDLLPNILPMCNTPLIIFIDDHWGAKNPLLDELRIIADSGLRPCLAIHDFKVPDHPELGFDSYNGQDYEWSWIEQSIESIYGKDGYTYYYNSEAEGAKRGVIFIEPK